MLTQEVIIRNLVAYEAMSKFDESESESLVFTQYIELMNGIIETRKDVKVLRDHGIPKTESLMDDEVLKIFNGTHEFYKEIADVNNYYNSLRKVKARKFAKKCASTL
nr:putative upf0481 protein [Quercus suber]